MSPPTIRALPDRPLLLGHRGHRLARLRLSSERENTLPAFDHALACGCDGLELDIHRTRDGRLVVHHDPLLSGVVIAATQLRQLRRLEPSLPTLRQVLRRYRDRAWLDLEVKAAGCAEPLVAELRALPPRRGFVVSSFDLVALRALARLASDLPLCLNLKRPVAPRQWKDLPLVAVAPHVGLARAWFLRRLRRIGLPALIWTVNQPRQMRALARAGVLAIISDNPRLLVDTLASSDPARRLALAAGL